MKSNNAILLQILVKISELKNPTDFDISKILVKNPSLSSRTFAKSELISAYKSFVIHGKINHDEDTQRHMLSLLRMKKIRTLSGVTPVTVLTKPFPCPGNCIYCPNDPQMPKSYLLSEPGAQRAFSNEFDPYLQVFNRLAAFRNNGHPTDKVELIVLGGTWSYYPKNYQLWFIKRCFDALNKFNPTKSTYASLSTNESKCTWKDLIKAQKKNETSKSRCVGLVLETRPDFIDKNEVLRLRKLSATKIQIGIQSLNNKVLRLNKRGHGIKETANAFNMLRQAGFKIHVHWMPNLLGSTSEKDVEDYRRLFSDERFKPDEIKIYPCSLISNTELMKHYKNKTWKPYSTSQLTEVLKKCVMLTPRWCRITRIVRDISSDDIVAGNKISNIRQDVEKDLLKSGCKIVEIRNREIKNEKIILSKLKLRVSEYKTAFSNEFFLEYVSESDKLVGFLRLSLPKSESAIKELKRSAIIREVHVYGQTLDIGKEEKGRSQHVGVGTELINKAKDIAKTNNYKNISVISSVGTREYYKKLGFKQKILYQYQPL